jgi:hypothetical protein
VVSCCLSATGVRFSGHPHPARELCLPHGRPTAAEHGGGPVGVSTFHTHEIRPGWVPSLPRGRRCSSWTGCRARPAPAASQRLSLHSVTTSHHGATIHEASTKVHAIHPSGLPLTRDPRMGQGSFGFPLGLRTLPLPATHAKGGARHRARARDYTTDITSALLTASPLAKCDIVSQRQMSEPGGSMQNGSAIVLMPVSAFAGPGLGFLVDRLDRICVSDSGEVVGYLRGVCRQRQGAAVHLLRRGDDSGEL